MPLPAAQANVCCSASASFAAGAFLLRIGRLTWKVASAPNELAPQKGGEADTATGIRIDHPHRKS
jgi:hypothetical protein